MKKILLSAAFMLLVIPAMLTSNEISAQTVSVKIGSEDNKEKKEETKEKVVEKETVKSGPTLEQELKKAFGMKSETSLGGPRIENLGKYFLDKYTGQVSMVTYHRGEPVRWNILRDNVPEDWVDDPETVNYQLVKYGEGTDNVLLLNINSGAMWAIDTRGLTFSYKNTRLKFIPAVDTSW
ncbi:MAG: hypothetical protein E7118_06955 [Bacteroidales bacterium]|nr:hypothetical protein [Bacteroidales bacterium]MBE6234196.1 hypothetical protein [Bacteroidales bacterium]